MQKDLTREIVLASEGGELDKVKALLKEDASPNAMGPNSGAIHVAAFNGFKSVVETLLKAGADPNVADKQQFYPLHLAASKGHSATCKVLVQDGAKMDVKTADGGTALHVAAASGFDKVVSVLISLESDIQALDINNATPLHSAALQGEHKCIKLLLDAGANLNAEDNFQENALFKALFKLKQSAISGWKTEGTNSGRNVKYTVEKGAFRYYDGYPNENDTHQLGKILPIKDQHYCASQSWGPQQHLTYLKAYETILLLLKAGIEVNSLNNQRQTPMWWACDAGDAKIIKALYDAGAKFTPKLNEEGLLESACIHRISSSGRIDGLEMHFQLDKNFDINEPDLYGWTPLHYLADMGGHVRMAELLFEKGADKTIKSTQNRGIGANQEITASEVAYHWGDKEIGDLLK